MSDPNIRTAGEHKAADIIRIDLLEIAELDDLEEIKTRLTSLCLTANQHLTPGVLRMLAEVYPCAG